MKLKGRLIVHGSRDANRDSIRADCTAADRAAIRLLLSIGTCLGVTFGGAEVRGDNMHTLHVGTLERLKRSDNPRSLPPPTP